MQVGMGVLESVTVENLFTGNVGRLLMDRSQSGVNCITFVSIEPVTDLAI